MRMITWASETKQSGFVTPVWKPRSFSRDKVHVVSYFRLKFQLDIQHVLANSEAFDETARISRLV